MSYNRMDDRFISSDILRALMHKDMLDRIASFHTDNFQYVIKLDEVYRSDLAAYRAYGTADLRWVFRVIAGHEAESEELPAGTTYNLPDITWLRNTIRTYAEMADGIDND